MGLYCEHILPSLIHATMRQRLLEPYRQRLLTAASGHVLEIGIGSGLNLLLYPRAVERVIGIDPSPRLLARARGVATAAAMPVALCEGSAELLPIEDASIDTVVTSWTLCTIPDVVRAIGELRRILKSSGRLLFVEHGLSPDKRVRWWQDWLTPTWRCIGGGCHLNRSIPRIIESGGFQIERLATGYAHGPRLMTFMYEGCARPR